MNNTPLYQSRDDRYGKTERKNLTLTTAAIEAIQAYAEQHGLYFSVAIESLALLGLGHTTAESLPRLVSNLLERVFNRQFNRFARLLARTALTAGEINYKSDVLLLQTIWREARLDEDNFVRNMQVSTNPHEQPAALVRQIRDDICRDAQEQAVARLRQKLRDLDYLAEQESAGDA